MTIIHNFLNGRKEEWLKKRLKNNMSDAEEAELQQKANQEYALETWLPKAAKRAKQLSMITHPGKFSHPSAKISSIIANAKPSHDGYLRTGNVDYDMDVTGNAAALDVYKFLVLPLEDGQTVLEHLEMNSPEIHAIFTIPNVKFEELKQEFLAIKKTDVSQKTDDLVKQVYFPAEDDYHLLSLLTPSGLLTKIKKELDNIRFSDSTKEAKELRKKGAFHEKGYDEIYELTETKYGGTQPQNISELNTKNGGKAYLLRSVPPALKKRDIRLPTRDFFSDTLSSEKMKENFQLLHKLIKCDVNNRTVRKNINDILKAIIDGIMEYAFQVRIAGGDGWTAKEHYKNLPLPQRIWLDDFYLKERENANDWLDKICEAFARWIIQAYEKVLKKEHIMLGDGELQHIRKFVDSAVKEDKEFLK